MEKRLEAAKENIQVGKTAGKVNVRSRKKRRLALAERNCPCQSERAKFKSVLSEARRENMGSCDSVNMSSNNELTDGSSPPPYVNNKFYCGQKERKNSIGNKMQNNNSPIFTRQEEEDIDLRADNYVRSVLPDSRYYILPQHAPLYVLKDRTSVVVHRDKTRNKSRRSYNNIDCYVTHQDRNDYYDNTQMLPIGCRLIKPMFRLVELVARAINGSPDGLLQVQQIYSVLQNRYPYYRYMDKPAINSWRSSIRHALYQKWFKKTRFIKETINTRGCYWRIVVDVSPTKLTLSRSPVTHDDVTSKLQSTNEYRRQREINSTVIKINGKSTKTSKDAQQEVVDIATEYGIQVPDSFTNQPRVDMCTLKIPSPVRDPDPILATCSTVDWLVTDWLDINTFSQTSSNSLQVVHEETKFEERTESTALLSPLVQQQLETPTVFDTQDQDLLELWSTPDLTTELVIPVMDQFSPLTPITKDETNCMNDSIFISSQSTF